MKKFKLTETHNPQDFFNGNEPPELSKTYWTANLEKSVLNGIIGGFTVVITEQEETTNDAEV